ncbi:MAG: ABC transporter substrate-binding protein, partial [bacterium]
MSNEPPEHWSRREFLGEAIRVGAAGIVGLQSARLAAHLLGQSRAFGAEPPPETTTLRLTHAAALCLAPQYVAEDFLAGEGFTEISYVKTRLGALRAVASGEVNMSMTFSGPLIMQVDAGDPIVMLAGVHPGCFELFGTDRIRTVRDLKGKTVAVAQLRSSQHVFLSSIAAHVGLDPRKDITWIRRPFAESMQLLAERKIDAYMAFPPEPQELRAKKIGHVVVNSMMDRPWSQYFCCLVGANREFVRKHPVATKRAVRAILKAADRCVKEPERVARFLVDRGYTQRYDYALQTLKDISYGRWREYDPEDTVRFYALRLHEAGLIKTS